MITIENLVSTRAVTWSSSDKLRCSIVVAPTITSLKLEASTFRRVAHKCQGVFTAISLVITPRQY